MEIVSTCALRVASSLWQPTLDHHALTIVCKATYLLAPGLSRLAPVQDAPIASDLYWDDDERGSLRSPSDVAPFKPRAEVIVVGHVYAPGGAPVSRLSPRLAVGEVDKTIDVLGDCSLLPDGRAGEPAPFVSLPLRWERAAAGPENPVGMRLDDAADGRGLPNFLPHGDQPSARTDSHPPAGFGPLAPAWPERAGKLGARAAGWDHKRWREQPLPPDVDGGYFNAAPHDQQLSEIRPDVRILLEHLHEHHPRLVTELEPLAPRASFEGEGPTQDVLLRCDTLTLDTGRGLATLVWRGNVPLARPDQTGRIVVSLEPRPALGPSSSKPASAPPAASPALVEEPAPRVFPARPPMIGPLATPGMVDRREAAPPPEKEPSPTREPAPPPDPAPEEPAPLPLANFPLERCAAIAASIARRRDGQATILDAHDLAAPTWEALEAHWQAAIRRETARGKQGLLRSHDEAYVGQLEKERGPITVDDCARLSVASERGTEQEVLAELDLPPAAWLRLQRVWLKKTALAPALGQALREAVARAREA